MGQDDSGSSTAPVSISPLEILNLARKSVPAVDYALGAAGVSAAGAITVTFLGNGRAAAIILGGMLVAMVLLFIFAKLVTGQNSAVVPAGKVLIWAVTIFFCTFLIFTASAVAIGQPESWANILGISKKSRLDDLSDKIDFTVVGTNLDAINALVGIASTTADGAERNAAVAILKHKLSYPVTRNFDIVARPIRKALIEGIVKIRHGDIHADFANGELKDQDLPGADLDAVNAAGVKFTQSFLIGDDFRTANLRGADFSSTYLRNAWFTNSDLSGARLDGADWFNAYGFTGDQLRQSATTHFEQCPKNSSGLYAISSFIKHADDMYGVPFSNWADEEQQGAQLFWKEYARPGGLCDMVGRGALKTPGTSE